MFWKNKKRTIIEVLLVLIILIQVGAIYFLYNLARGNFLKDASEITRDMGCVGTANYIFEYYKNEQYEELIGLGEYLYKNGFEDKMLLHQLATAYFVTGNAKKAVEYLEKAILTGYLCKTLKPSLVETKELDEAVARYQLSEIYSLLGDKEKSNKELLAAHDIVKRIFSEKYKPNIADKIFKNASLFKARGKFLNKKGNKS
jgi:tetratricopeptide (TPR) repeat protein